MNQEVDQWDAQMGEAIARAWSEDVGTGDVTSLACIPEDAQDSAGFLMKGDGVIAGVEVARRVLAYGAPGVKFEADVKDGDRVLTGQVIAWVEGPAREILTAERLALNFMQRMSGIATGTRRVVDILEGTGTRVLIPAKRRRASERLKRQRWRSAEA